MTMLGQLRDLHGKIGGVPDHSTAVLPLPIGLFQGA
jgi:hypothetical protein